VREDLLDDGLLKVGSDDLHLAATVWAVHQVELKHALEQPRPSYQLACCKPALYQYPVMAATVSSQPGQEADFRWLGSAGQSQLAVTPG
jgi:hypothetical protein